MTNAKNEFLSEVKGKPTLKCASIRFEIDYYDSKLIVLKVGYSKKDYTKFLNELDFNYDSGYGSQKIFGLVWFEDNTWLKRSEYDGSEWWSYIQLPEIPMECK